MKYRPQYPDGAFVSLVPAQAWVGAFVAWYNEDHQHSGVRFVTPVERHEGRETAILNRRHEVYREARARTPERWSGTTRNWTPIVLVCLNPATSSRSDRPQPFIAANLGAERRVGQGAVRRRVLLQRWRTPRLRESATIFCCHSVAVTRHSQTARNGTP